MAQPAAAAAAAAAALKGVGVAQPPQNFKPAVKPRPGLRSLPGSRRGSRSGSPGTVPVTPLAQVTTASALEEEDALDAAGAETLQAEERRALTALLGVQAEQEALERQKKAEMFEIERKYLEKSNPLYSRRAEILSGASSPRTEELRAGQKHAHAQTASLSSRPEEQYYAALKAALEDINVPKEPSTAANPGAPVQEFWLTVLRNHPGVRALMSHRDVPALKHLVDVRLSYLSGPSTFYSPFPTEDVDAKNRHQGELGYTLKFFFSPNEFFENEVLEKTYVFKKELDWVGNTVVDRSEGTSIKWKNPQNDLTKDVGALGARPTSRVVKHSTDATSFFKFFDPPERPSFEAMKDVGDEDLEELEFEIELDDQLGEDFKERIIPRALDYYTGKAREWEEDHDEWDEDETDYEDECEDY